MEGDERTSERQLELTSIGPNVLVTPSPNSPQGNETSAVSVPKGNSQHLFVSYNSNPGVVRADGTLTHCGWSYSADGGSTWTSTDDYATPLPGWGNIGQGWNYWYCLGDTYSTAVGVQSPAGGGTDQRVAMVAVAKSKKQQNQRFDVGLWTSTDRGVTFPNMMRVSDQPGTGSTTAETGTDGPKIAADPTNQAVYVFWWASPTAGVVKNLLRKITIGPQGQLTPAPPIDLTGSLAVPNAIDHPSITIKPATAPGNLPTIYLAYPDTRPTVGPCDDPEYWRTSQITWWLSESTDGGVSWAHHQVDYDAEWPWCLSATFQGANKPYISAVYDPVEDRVVLAHSRSQRDAGGRYVGTRIHTKTWPWPGFATWIPICNPELCPLDPTGAPTNCLVNGAPPVGESYCNQWGHAVSVRSESGNRRAAVVWHDTRDSDPVLFPHPPVGDSFTVRPLESDIWGHAIRPGVPFDGPPNNPPPPTQSRLTPLAVDVPWEEKATNGNLWWGDYEAGVVDLGAKFYAIWADNRDGTTTAKLRGAFFNE